MKTRMVPTTAARGARVVSLLLVALLPTLMGGCPEFRNQVVDIANATTVSILLTEDPPRDAVETAARETAVAALGLFFDQFRADTR